MRSIFFLILPFVSFLMNFAIHAQERLFLKGQLETDFSQDKVAQAVWMITAGGYSPNYGTVFFISGEGHFLMTNHTFQAMMETYQSEYKAYGNQEMRPYHTPFDIRKRDYYDLMGPLQFDPTVGHSTRDSKIMIPLAQNARIEKRPKVRDGLITFQRGIEIQKVEILVAPPWDKSRYNDLLANRDFVIGSELAPKNWTLC